LNSNASHLHGNSVKEDQGQSYTDTGDTGSGAAGLSDALILIQPITTLASAITDQVKEVSEITGIDGYTTRQKLTGSVMDILCAGSDMQRFQEVSKRLSAAGYQVALVHKSELANSSDYRRAVTARLDTNNNGAITFLDINGVEIQSYNRDSQMLIVIGSLEPGQYGASKALLASLYGETSNMGNSTAERLKDLSKQEPALMIIDESSLSPVFIDATMFNYDFLEKQRSLSLAQNFLTFVKLLEDADTPGRTHINTDFGQKTLPLGALASKPKTKQDTQKVFAMYSKLVTLAHKQGFFAAQRTGPENKPQQSASNPVLELVETLTQASLIGVTGALQPGPAVNPADKSAKVKPVSIKQPESTSPALPPPPPGASNAYSESGIENLVIRARRLGPPAFIFGCVALAVSLAAFSISQNSAINWYWSFLPLGVALCSASITFARCKGAISRLPTSRIRSMPMGIVEVKGQAKRKYDLKAPHSLVNCIYYNYRVLERTKQTLASGAKTETWRVINRGDSGRISFYVEDNTGKALVDPTGAIISGAQTSEYSSSFAEMISGGASQPNRRIIETVIPEGAELYVLGFARPTAKAPQARRQEYRERLKALKADQGLMSGYDADGDGTISIEEWAVAKADLDNQILQERINSDPLVENVVIGKHSGSGIFYISDKVESDILSSYRWKIPLLGLSGFALLVKGLWEVFGK
jgi:hypothetical protein